MKEKLLFVLPKPLEELLMALSVFMQYMLVRKAMGRSVDEVIVVCPYEDLHGLVRACWVWAEVVTTPTQKQLVEADLIHEFDTKSTYEVTKAVRKPIGEAYAIRLGANMMRLLPPVLVEDTQEEIGTLLIAARNNMDGTDESWLWPHLEDFHDMLKAGGVPVIFLPATASWNELREAVGKSSVIVGVRGTATLLAAAASKVTMELSPKSKEHKEWFKKTECKTYRMLYGDLKNMTPAFVWAQIEKLIRDAKGPKFAPEVAEEANV